MERSGSDFAFPSPFPWSPLGLVMPTAPCPSPAPLQGCTQGSAKATQRSQEATSQGWHLPRDGRAGKTHPAGHPHPATNTRASSSLKRLSWCLCRLL